MVFVGNSKKAAVSPASSVNELGAVDARKLPESSTSIPMSKSRVAATVELILNHADLPSITSLSLFSAVMDNSGVVGDGPLPVMVTVSMTLADVPLILAVAVEVTITLLSSASIAKGLGTNLI